MESSCWPAVPGACRIDLSSHTQGKTTGIFKLWFHRIIIFTMKGEICHERQTPNCRIF